MKDHLETYYEQELTALRHLSQEFARKYPKVAGRLLIESEGVSADPHVERLMQGFAFLTARISKRIDDSFPELTDAFFEILYPQYLRPLPSSSIAYFDINQKGSPLTGHYPIPRGTTLLTAPLNGLQCKFKTVYPVDLYPIRIVEAQLQNIGYAPFSGKNASKSVAVLRIQCETIGTFVLEQCNFNQLRFFIDAEKSTAFDLYEIIHNNTEEVLITKNLEQADGPKFYLPKTAIQPVGFGTDEAMIPQDNRAFSGYRLLQEYYAYPEKFLYFDLTHLQKMPRTALGKQFEIVIFLSEFERFERLDRLKQAVQNDTFKLFTTPIINLFSQRGEPIQVNHKKTEYPIIAERRFPLGLEVYNIEEVTRVRRLRGQDDMELIPPMFDLKSARADTLNPTSSEVFWVAKREASSREHDLGHDVFLRLIDRSLEPTTPTDDVLTLTLTCTNRDYPASLSIGNAMGDLYFETGQPVALIKCLRKPSRSLRPKLGKDAYWRLISHLSLNHLSLVEGGREALLEILNLYNFNNTLAHRNEIGSILTVHSQKTTTRIGALHKSAFAQGTTITLHIDEEGFVGGGVYLFGNILDHFFALYAAANTFTTLNITSKQREKPIKQWPARLGSKVLI